MKLTDKIKQKLAEKKYQVEVQFILPTKTKTKFIYLDDLSILDKMVRESNGHMKVIEVIELGKGGGV